MTSIFKVGFASDLGQMRSIREKFDGSKIYELSRKSPALIIWTEIFWVKPGDIVKLLLQRPDGRLIVDKDNIVEKRQARRIIFSGKKRSEDLWMPGKYFGKVIIERTETDGRLLRIRAKSSIEVVD